MSNHDQIQFHILAPDGTRIPAGKIHPAAARKLVANDLAAWQDGQLIIHARSIALTMIDHMGSMAWIGPQDGDKGNLLAPIELERRKAWFLHFLQATVYAHSRTGQSHLQEIHQASEHVWMPPISAILEPPPAPLDPADDIWFQDDPSLPEPAALTGLLGLWECYPTLDKDFRIATGATSEDDLTEESLALFRLAAPAIEPVIVTSTSGRVHAKYLDKDREISTLATLQRLGECHVIPCPMNGSRAVTRHALHPFSKEVREQLPEPKFTRTLGDDPSCEARIEGRVIEDDPNRWLPGSEHDRPIDHGWKSLLPEGEPKPD